MTIFTESSPCSAAPLIVWRKSKLANAQVEIFVQTIVFFVQMIYNEYTRKGLMI